MTRCGSCVESTKHKLETAIPDTMGLAPLTLTTQKEIPRGVRLDYRGNSQYFQKIRCSATIDYFLVAAESQESSGSWDLPRVRRCPGVT
jgi:hypothetical protein